jgi:transcriptional regulator GlxA family with amidase domain
MGQIKNPGLKELESRVRESSSFESQIENIARYFENIKYEIHPVNRALEKVSESRGMNSVSDLANELKISERQLERIFKQYVGLSPKFYSRIIRFSTIFQLKEQGDPNWIDLTYESGFADQSHFIRNFKAFTGEDPSSYSFGDQNMANFFMKKK